MRQLGQQPQALLPVQRQQARKQLIQRYVDSLCLSYGHQTQRGQHFHQMPGIGSFFFNSDVALPLLQQVWKKNKLPTSGYRLQGDQ